MKLIRRRSAWWCTALSLAAAATTAKAIELDVNPVKIQEGLKIAGGSPASRAAFHKPYLFTASDSSIERIEVVTEFRRVVLIGEDKLFRGDQMAAQNVRETQNALRDWHRKVSVVVRVTFPLQNVLANAPRTEVVLIGASGDVPRLDLHNQTEYALQSASRNRQQTVIGVVAEAVFAAEEVGQRLRTASVRMDGRELARLAIDFATLD
jgi:hypothetical protein